MKDGIAWVWVHLGLRFTVWVGMGYSLGFVIHGKPKERIFAMFHGVNLFHIVFSWQRSKMGIQGSSFGAPQSRLKPVGLRFKSTQGCSRTGMQIFTGIPALPLHNHMRSAQRRSMVDTKRKVQAMRVGPRSSRWLWE